MRLGLAIVMLGAAWGLIAIAGPAAEASEPARRIQRPDWAEIPSGDEMSRYYPARAVRENISGRATLTCEVTAEGRLTGCTAVENSPGGYGFDQAALGLSASFRMKPATREGKPVAGGTITIPVVFTVPEGAPSMGPAGMKFGDGVIAITKLSPNSTQPVDQAMVFPCPDQGGQCVGHTIVWTQRPDDATAKAILTRSGETSGLSVAECTLAKDGAPESCTIGKSPSPAALYAMQEALSLMRAAPQTQDGLPTAGTRVQIPFQWDWLWAGVKTTP